MRPITCLLFCAAFLVPGLVLAQDSGTPILVRVGEHPTFSRIVFDWPTKAPYRVEQAGGRATVHFDQPGTLDLSRAIIGDARNDENLFIAQLHLAFLRFHNRVVDACKAGST